ncbi:MAG: hypothetical protein WCJ56_12540 [bacterium]
MEYDRCVSNLGRTGILTHLPQSACLGVIGIDGGEYPLPTREQVAELFTPNSELIAEKIPQGFARLELTPLALPTAQLIELSRVAIINHGTAGEIFQTRHTPDDPLIPVRVNSEKHVWVWETLRQALDSDEMIYFPREYTSEHWGMSKTAAVHDRHICALPGWSVGLVESTPIMPAPGHGETFAGRKQLETGNSPREYLQQMKSTAYRGETGNTLEDFLTRFLTHLEATGEVSNDIFDINALWCLAQYLVIPYAEVVPAARWHRSIGRLRLDLHRTGNKQCTWNVGGATVVRLVGK